LFAGGITFEFFFFSGLGGSQTSGSLS